MGSGQSATRKVSFGVDDEDRVRVLRGVKLSEDVLQRMRGTGPANQTADIKPPPPTSPKKESPPPSPRPSPTQQQRQPRPQPSPQTAHTDTKEELKKSYERQQTVVQEELTKVARREREAARTEMSKALYRERLQSRQEREKAKLLAKQLEKKEAELKALDAFFKEQLAQLEKRNLDRYKQTEKQFHDQATKSEALVKARNTEPVCINLQSQILNCYKENREQTLQCSDLAKTYMQCIDAAKKNLLVNHG
ncbi:MICOS complex subunit mic25a isoform X2 [Coregonus clupeaformis]|uniref:MICOS complex subunit mic25a isoform X2 n=1 Tax=Coregonus clupeaformis TaxID=59861 RepID=UPI001BE10DB3|nr:MICOS complex subunit mic25a isoform X2 [Coregonus clupeaformis]